MPSIVISDAILLFILLMCTGVFMYLFLTTGWLSKIKSFNNKKLYIDIVRWQWINVMGGLWCHDDTGNFNRIMESVCNTDNDNFICIKIIYIWSLHICYIYNIYTVFSLYVYSSLWQGIHIVSSLCKMLSWIYFHLFRIFIFPISRRILSSKKWKAIV